MLKPAVLVLILAFGGLAACDSADERAQKHYETGVALLEKGDVDRALVEFRNVFKLNGQHLEARLAYAAAERGRDNVREAYAQYLRVVEQYPENFEARRALTELALAAGDWDEVTRHLAGAAALQPDDAMVRAITVSAAYRTALQTGIAADADAATTAARELVPLLPDSMVPREVILDTLARKEDWPALLAEIDAALAAVPSATQLYQLRLSVLNEMGDTAGVEAQLKDMVTRFPDDATVPAMLVRWYLSQGNPDAAEANLRAEVEKAATPERQLGARLRLVRFLAEVRSVDAALAELDAAIKTRPEDAAVFRALRAGFDFDLGNRDKAVAEMQAILATADQDGGMGGAGAGVETNRIRVELGRMMFENGDRDGARAEIDKVLAADPTQGDALKLSADWLIRDDQTGEAMIALRTALGESPRDAATMTLMARAHERDGNRDLMGEMLSLAVEASNRAPEETLRYAAFLFDDQKFPAAEEALINALRLAPNNPAILSALGSVYIEMDDWPRIEQVIAQLRALGSPDAGATANELTARLLQAQKRGNELVGFLEGLVTDGQAGLEAEAAIIRSHLADNNVEAALKQAQGLLDRDPENPSLKFIYGSVLAVVGDTEQAGTIFRGLVTQDPKLEPVWQALYGIEIDRGDIPASAAVVTEGLAALPQSVPLRWMQASAFQAMGDIAGAIAVYEQLYTENSDSTVFANNLASLLSTYNEDPESLERAHVVARRLRGSDVPAFQDTYGWIAFRRGDLDDALAHLEPAAAALTRDAATQYHLGMTYAAMGRADDALAQLRKAEALIDAEAPPRFAPALAAEIARLTAPPPAVPDPPPAVPAPQGSGPAGN